MRKLILVKYAPEIFLKGLNKNKFEKRLRDNIKKKLKGLEFEIINDQNIIILYLLFKKIFKIFKN